MTPSNVSRASSQSRRADLLKSNILSKEEEARMLKEKKDKMDEIKQRYSRRSRQNSNSATRPPQVTKRTPSQVSVDSGSKKSSRVPAMRRRRASPAGPGGE